MWRLRAYWRIMAISAKEEGANPRRLITSILQLLARLGLIVAIYQVAYHFNPRPGLSYANAMWSVSIYLAFVLSLGIRNISREIDKEIKAGGVETQLVKPLDWRLVMLSRLLGKSGLEFLLQLILIPSLLTVFVGLPDVSYVTPIMVAAFVAMGLLSMVTVASMFITVGLSAFWLNDAMAVYRIVDKLMAAFGGAFVPIVLLPSVVQSFVRFSPFGVYASPQYIFSPTISNLLVPTLLAAVVWSVVLAGICQLVWKRAERRIEVNGG